MSLRTKIRGLGVYTCGWLFLFGALANRAAADLGQMPAAPANFIEAGTPNFLVLGPESLGLSTPPTDIHLLPDGRTLVVGAEQLAIGDGVRWESFARAEDTEPLDLENVAVDSDGQIFAGVAGGFARIEFIAGARWRYSRVATLPDSDPALATRILTRVFAAAGDWYWTAGSGVMVAWKPGHPARIVGYVNDTERVFEAGNRAYVSDPSVGRTFRLEHDTIEPIDSSLAVKVDHTIICSAPLADGSTLAGTYSVGLRLFDGRELKPFVTSGPLAGINRIADLCATDGDLYCAALDNVGLAFFDQTGRIVQTLDLTIDHRFARTRRLLHGAGGVVWALLDEGIAQIEFPARLSRLDSFISTGLTYAQVARHEGHLWLLAGGKAQRAVYAEDHRLVRFAVDTPAPFVSSINAAGPHLLAGTTDGLYWRSPGGWKLIDPNLHNANVAPDPTSPGRWLVVAQNQVGWLHATPEGPRAEIYDAPELGIPFSRVVQGEGAFWVELGSSRAARITVSPEGLPIVRILVRADGFPDGWVQIFETAGRIRFVIAGTVVRYDPDTARIVPDPGFLAEFPGVTGLHGRPIQDALGRVWLSTDRTVLVFARDKEDWWVTVEPMPPALRPISFLAEDNGVVWMHQRQQLFRFDPRMPEADKVPLHAVISHVQTTGSDRHWTTLGATLPTLEYTDNSLTFHFLAPNHLFRHPVTFDVMLQGSDRSWSATGPAGVASFSRLKEGTYVLHVRPRSGDEIGAEDTVSFRIRPPWQRTPLAYALYALSALLFLAAIARLWSHVARKEKLRLEHLVAARTAELRHSEENYRRLNEELEHRVQERTAELTASNRELESFSYSISHDLRSPLRNISGFAELLRKRANTEVDTEGRRFLDIIINEAIRLGHLIDSLLVFSRLARAELQRKPCRLSDLAAAVRDELAPQHEGRSVEWRIAALPEVEGDPTLLRQVFANLMGNALKFTRRREHAIIEIGVLPGPTASEQVLFVRDNGVGFDPKYTDKLFGVFQRLHHAREYEGSGIGLANVRRIVSRHGGRVWAEGQTGEGATFFVSLPAA